MDELVEWTIAVLSIALLSLAVYRMWRITSISHREARARQMRQRIALLERECEIGPYAPREMSLDDQMKTAAHCVAIGHLWAMDGECKRCRERR